MAEHFGGVQIVIERTVFKQLNNNVGENVGSDVGKNVGSDVGNEALTTTQKKIAERYNTILEIIKSDPFITAVQLSEKLSVSDRTIERDIAKLQVSGVLIREGDKNGGRWIIIK